MLLYETARLAFDSLRESKQKDQVSKLYGYAIKYAHLRARYQLATYEEKSELGTVRTTAHNTFIDQCNILSRMMAGSGEDNSWRGTLGNDRKVIGDFACYLSLFLSLLSR